MYLISIILVESLAGVRLMGVCLKALRFSIWGFWEKVLAPGVSREKVCDVGCPAEPAAFSYHNLQSPLHVVKYGYAICRSAPISAQISKI
jgi:hypothetical protein